MTIFRSGKHICNTKTGVTFTSISKRRKIKSYKELETLIR